MARKQVSSNTIPPAVKRLVLVISPEEASRLVNSRLVSGQRIADKLIGKYSGTESVYIISKEFERWDSYNLILLGRMFTTQSFATSYETCASRLRATADEFLESTPFMRRWFAAKKSELESIKDQLTLFDVAPKSMVVTASTAKSFGNKVFIVHGHDKATKEAVARFLEHLDLDVVILHERPNKGRTIIEKLLEESDIDVGYAVVLLTPDDVGKLASKEGEASPRARQNVILELGLFLAKLGRQRVHALYKEGVEVPTDYLGVLYTPLDDAGAWQVKLATELQAVGFDVDLNKLVA